MTFREQNLILHDLKYIILSRHVTLNNSGYNNFKKIITKVFNNEITTPCCGKIQQNCLPVFLHVARVLDTEGLLLTTVA